MNANEDDHVSEFVDLKARMRYAPRKTSFGTDPNFQLQLDVLASKNFHYSVAVEYGRQDRP